MHISRLFLLIWAVLLSISTTCASTKENKKRVDKQSPRTAVPTISNDSLSHTQLRKQWKLVFSDEFNDNTIDTSKWTVENSIKYRKDITLYADSNQVEEKEGNAYIYYRKSGISDTAYHAGRFHSKGKYAPTYGFLECRMHVVRPNGHQMAFWMMPEGEGMHYPKGVDGTANDGAEIDIVESNKLNSYSTGLHWDSYHKPEHKGAGKNIKAPGMHDTEYHIYALEWSPAYLKFYFNGKLMNTISRPEAIPHVPEFLYFSGSCFGDNDWLHGDIRKNEYIQMGGTDKAYVDYVRVFQLRK
jgi:beta-glucanase (GH16 family)